MGMNQSSSNFSENETSNNEDQNLNCLTETTSLEYIHQSQKDLIKTFPANIRTVYNSKVTKEIAKPFIDKIWDKQENSYEVSKSQLKKIEEIRNCYQKFYKQYKNINFNST